MMPEKKLLFFSVGLVVLTGCFGKSIKKNNTQSQSITKTDFTFFKAFHGNEDLAAPVSHVAVLTPAQKEARLVDVPIPLQSLLQETELEENIVVFTTPLKSEELVDFYHREMERLGWIELINFSRKDPLLLFKKPDRWLAVTIQQGETKFWRRDGLLKVVIRQAAAPAINY